MARRRKSRMFKQISNVHVESVSDNDWSSFLRLEKQNDSLNSAYVDKIRISWITKSNESSDAQGQGLLFVASYDKALDSSTPANNDGQVICASASRGGGGVVTLDIRRRITDNYTGTDADVLQLLQGSGGAPIYLHLHKSTTANDPSEYMLVIETWGRWFSAESL